MFVPVWLILVSVVTIILATLIIKAISANNKSENTCTTCGDSLSVNNSMRRCSKCGQIFCIDGTEELAQTINFTGAQIEIKPSKKNKGFPCGMKLITVEIDKPQTEQYFCKKHSPRPPFHHKVVPVS